jgi:hypothetical protein
MSGSLKLAALTIEGKNNVVTAVTRTKNAEKVLDGL